MYYIYILRCSDGSLYSGITTDIGRRYSEHKAGKGKGAKYTSSRAPVGVELLWTSPDRQSASKLEYKLKKLTKRVKEELISGKITVEDLFAETLDCSLYASRPIPSELAAFKGGESL